MSRRPPSLYSREQLNHLAVIIERSRPLCIARYKLNDQLLELMHVVGRADVDSQEVAWFREAGASEPSHAELVRQFRAIATAKDPLDPKICHGLALTILNTAARRRWTHRRHQKRLLSFHPLHDAASDPLSTSEINEVREMALGLATYHEAFVRRGAPNKADQDALVDGIAEIFVRFAGLGCRLDLPHSTNSAFITFAHIAMQPFCSQTEGSKSAIAKRWKRIKNHDASTA